MSETSRLAPVIRSIAWRLNLALWLNQTLGWAGALLALAAIAAVALKMLWPPAAPLGWWVAALLPLAGARGWLECRRRRLFFTPGELMEVIDHRFRDDGSLSAAWENAAPAPAELYEAAAAEVAARLPRLDFVFYGKKSLPLMVLLAAALAVPSRPLAPAAQGEAIISALTQPLAAKLAENEKILPEESLKELKEEIAALQKDEQGISKEKWEAAEELRQRIDGAIEQSRQNVTATVASLNQLSDPIDAPGNVAGKLGGGARDSLLKDMERAMKDGKTALPSAMRKEIGDLASQMRQGGAPSPELRKRLENLKSELGKCPGGNCDGPGQIGRDGQGQGQSEGQGQGSNGESLDRSEGIGLPGQGGVTGGRGDAPLTLGDPKRAGGARFKDRELQNSVLSPEDMVDLGITPLAPKPDPGRFSPGTVRQFQAREGAAVSRTRISPSQKDVIAKYFSGE